MVYRKDIDGLRAVAVLAVVGFHAFPKLVSGGFVGVDVFFVISGFLISSIIFSELNSGHFSILIFYAKRIRRIFPALIVVIAGCYIYSWFVLLPTEFRQLGKHILGGSVFISNFVLLKESGYFDTSADEKPFLHLWSLGIEEQFYIIFPIILFLVWKKRKYLPVILAGFFILSMIYNLYIVKKSPVIDFYSPASRFWELMLGVGLGYLAFLKNSNQTTQKQSLPSISNLKIRTVAAGRNFAILVGLILIAFSAFNLDKTTLFPGFWALLPTLGAIFIIAAGQEALLNERFLGNPVLVYIGKISYPLYLWHWPLLAFLRINYPPSPPPILIGLAIATSFLLSHITYIFLEKPLRTGSPTLRKSMILAGLLFFLGTIGGITFFKNGFPSRVSHILQGAESYDYLSQVHEMMIPYRSEKCFLKEDQNYDAFAPECGAAASGMKSDKKKIIFLWGDSHAAHLFPGLDSTKDDRTTIYQYTTSLCAPIIGLVSKERPHCKQINDNILELIARIRPEQVVLAASWDHYPWKNLHNTIKRLKMLGILKISLLGPVPAWKKSLSILLLEYYKANKRSQIPERLKYGLYEQTFILDKAMKQEFLRDRINFISIIDLLCNDAGCLTRIGKDKASLTSWDDAHLTIPGSTFIAPEIIR